MNEGKKRAANKLKTARGQIDGIIRMLEDDRYCVDVSTQILSAIGLLKKANIDVLNSHIRSCVATAILEGEKQGDEKIEEIINIIDKYIKWSRGDCPHCFTLILMKIYFLIEGKISLQISCIRDICSLELPLKIANSSLNSSSIDSL